MPGANSRVSLHRAWHSLSCRVPYSLSCLVSVSTLSCLYVHYHLMVCTMCIVALMIASGERICAIITPCDDCNACHQIMRYALEALHGNRRLLYASCSLSSLVRIRLDSGSNHPAVSCRTLIGGWGAVAEADGPGRRRRRRRTYMVHFPDPLLRAAAGGGGGGSVAGGTGGSVAGRGLSNRTSVEGTVVGDVAAPLHLPGAAIFRIPRRDRDRVARKLGRHGIPVYINHTRPAPEGPGSPAGPEPVLSDRTGVSAGPGIEPPSESRHVRRGQVIGHGNGMVVRYGAHLLSLWEFANLGSINPQHRPEVTPYSSIPLGPARDSLLLQSVGPAREAPKRATLTKCSPSHSATHGITKPSQPALPPPPHLEHHTQLNPPNLQHRPHRSRREGEVHGRPLDGAYEGYTRGIASRRPLYLQCMAREMVPGTTRVVQWEVMRAVGGDEGRTRSLVVSSACSTTLVTPTR